MSIKSPIQISSAVNSPLRDLRVFETVIRVGSGKQAGGLRRRGVSETGNLNMSDLSMVHSARNGPSWRACALLLAGIALFTLPARAEGTNAPVYANYTNAPVHADDTNSPARADNTNAPRARFKISGYGFLGDLRLKRIIKLLEVPKEKPEFSMPISWRIRR